MIANEQNKSFPYRVPFKCLNVVHCAGMSVSSCVSRLFNNSNNGNNNDNDNANDNDNSNSNSNSHSNSNSNNNIVPMIFQIYENPLKVQCLRNLACVY